MILTKIEGFFSSEFRLYGQLFNFRKSLHNWDALNIVTVISIIQKTNSNIFSNLKSSPFENFD